MLTWSIAEAIEACIQSAAEKPIMMGDQLSTSSAIVLSIHLQPMQQALASPAGGMLCMRSDTHDMNSAGGYNAGTPERSWLER